MEFSLKKKNRRRGKKGKVSESENVEPERDYTPEIVKIREEIHNKIVKDILPKLEVIKSSCDKLKKESEMQHSVFSRSTSENSVNSESSQSFQVNSSSLMALQQNHLPRSLKELSTKSIAATPLSLIESPQYRNVQNRTMSESSSSTSAIEKRKMRSSESDLDKKAKNPVYRYSRQNLLNLRSNSTEKYLNRLKSLKILGSEKNVSFVLSEFLKIIFLNFIDT